MHLIEGPVKSVHSIYERTESMEEEKSPVFAGFEPIVTEMRSNAVQQMLPK